MTTPRRLALTPGDPSGIGPDLCLALAQEPPEEVELVVFADAKVMEDRANQLGVPIRLQPFSSRAPVCPCAPSNLSLVQVDTAETVRPGIAQPANAAYVLECIRRATEGCLEGSFHAMVTAPVNKAMINDGGIAFTGHTEYIADLCGGTPVMMLACETLRVALVTTHLPLSQVSQAITPDILRQVIRTVDESMRSRFGCRQPTLLICGLNPHAGEGGHLGMEEIETIIPVIEDLKSAGLNLIGPVPADTAFTPRSLEGIDTVIAMYHDQGLPVLKHAGFGEAINITLGLPVIRTSVDHGTAYQLAGSGRAEVSSLRAAVNLAARLDR